MDNLKSPAYPHRSNALEGGHTDPGFTKLEKAALMIAQGLLANPTIDANNFHWRTVAVQSVDIARMISEEANK